MAICIHLLFSLLHFSYFGSAVSCVMYLSTAFFNVKSLSLLEFCSNDSLRLPYPSLSISQSLFLPHSLSPTHSVSLCIFFLLCLPTLSLLVLLSIGPLLILFTKLCYRCWFQREAQHDSHSLLRYTVQNTKQEKARLYVIQYSFATCSTSKMCNSNWQFYNSIKSMALSSLGFILSY